MVWHQYVWEATTGNEVDWSDDEDGRGQEPCHIDDWLDHNSDALGYMWGIVQTHAYESQVDLWPTMNKEALGRLCFDQLTYDPRSFEAAHWIDTNERPLKDLWRMLRPHFLRRIDYEEFAQFCYSHRRR